MKLRRLVLIITVLATAALAAVCALVGWDQAAKVTTVVAGLAALAAVGVEVWTALPDPKGAVSQSEPGPVPTSDHTGEARARGGAVANTGNIIGSSITTNSPRPKRNSGKHVQGPRL